MVTISVLGLDQYVVGHYSKEHTADLANLMEISEDDLNFFAPNSVLFHKGVEQTSWHTEIRVRLPRVLAPLEKKIADYLLSTFREFTIGVSVSFDYFDEEHVYSSRNEDYPLYIEEEHVLEVTSDGTPVSEEEEGEDADPADHAELDFNNPEELYLGDAFAGHEKDLESLDPEEEIQVPHEHHHGPHHH